MGDGALAGVAAGGGGGGVAGGRIGGVVGEGSGGVAGGRSGGVAGRGSGGVAGRGRGWVASSDCLQQTQQPPQPPQQVTLLLLLLASGRVLSLSLSLPPCCTCRLFPPLALSHSRSHTHCNMCFERGRHLQHMRIPRGRVLIRQTAPFISVFLYV